MLNTKFQELVNLARVDNENTSLIALYQQAIGYAVIAKVFAAEDPKALLTIQDWYRAAVKQDNNYHHLQAILNRIRPHRDNRSSTPRPFFTFHSSQSHPTLRQHRDPNAMDTSAGVIDVSVNTLSPENAECYKKGLCFYCNKPGHIARGCPEKAKTILKRPSGQTRGFTPRSSYRPPGPSVANLHAMMAELDIDNQVEFLQEQITKYDAKPTETTETETKKDF